MFHTTKARIRGAYERITLNWITTTFFIFSFLHCFAQGIMQSFLFTIDNDYASLSAGIVQAANVSERTLPWLRGTYGHLTLRMCNDTPHTGYDPCTDVFKSDTSSGNFPSFTRVLQVDNVQAILPEKVNPTIDNGIISVNIIPQSGPQIRLEPQCSEAMVYARSLFDQAKREDVSFVTLQFWLFAISVIAIIQDSVPHTLTVLATRSLATIWSAYVIWRTGHRRRIMDELVTHPGSPCSIDLLNAYFKTRSALEIPDLILHCTALCIAVYLSLTLLKVYNAQSFKRVGAPQKIMRYHKFFMAVLAILQLEVFVLLTAMALWLDELRNGPVARVSEHNVIYFGLVILTSIVLIPWVSLGWYSIRREMRRGILVFLGIALCFTAFWASMFDSQVYRWTYYQWPFFGIYATASLILAVLSLVFGIVCRLHFGQGLKQYIRAESALADLDFQPEVFAHDEEKRSITIDTEIIDMKMPELPEVPTPTYYVPELRSDQRSKTPSPAPAHLNLAPNRTSNVFAASQRSVSPLLSMSPNSPPVTVTKLSPLSPAGQDRGTGSVTWLDYYTSKD